MMIVESNYQNNTSN